MRTEKRKYFIEIHYKPDADVLFSMERELCSSILDGFNAARRILRNRDDVEKVEVHMVRYYHGKTEEYIYEVNGVSLQVE